MKINLYSELSKLDLTEPSTCTKLKYNMISSYIEDLERYGDRKCIDGNSWAFNNIHKTLIIMLEVFSKKSEKMSNNDWIELIRYFKYITSDETGHKYEFKLWGFT